MATTLLTMWNPHPGEADQDVLDLCLSINTRMVAGKSVHAADAGTPVVFLGEMMAREDVAPLVLDMAERSEELAPAGEAAIVCRDSAHADDIASADPEP